MSDTPETDAVTRSAEETPWTTWVCAGHAKRLERERDEARMKRDDVMRLTERQWLLKVACRLVSAGCKSEGILDSLDEVIRERDEARRELAETISCIEQAIDYHQVHNQFNSATAIKNLLENINQRRKHE